MLERSPDMVLPRVGTRPEAPIGGLHLGHEPPLDPLGLANPYGDRRGVSVRWLTGSILTGVSGALLLGAAIYVSLEGDTGFARLPDKAGLAPSRQAPQPGLAVSTRRGDRLVKTEPIIAARQSFKSPVTLKVGEREVIKLRPFVRIATSLSLTTGQYATDIPPFNPLKIFAENPDAPAQAASEAADANDADVSIVKLDLASVTVADDAPALSDEEVAAQMEEERRLVAEAGKRSMLPVPPQLMLSRTLRQPLEADAALAYANPTETPFSSIEIRVVPENVTVLPKAEMARESFMEERAVALKRGESLEQLLRANGADDEQIRSILAALWTKVRVSGLGEGQRVRLLIAPGKDGRRQIVRLMLVGETSIEAIAAADDRGAFVSVAPPDSGDKAATGAPVAEGEEDDDDEDSGPRLYESLYETALKNEIPAPVVEELIRVFAYDVDFQRHVSSGDSFELFYAEDEESGERIEVLYAALNVGGEARKIYRFQPGDEGGVEYLDPDGRSLKKFLLRKPMADGELRSGFGMRYHPILHYSKMHTGVDWASRIGTPVFASGNGAVMKSGWHSGYGRHLEVQHLNGYVTTYSHLSRFARGVSEGARVRQGQVIGYVGSSGLSTGPHLHYEVLVNGHFVNPMKIKVPRGRELDGRALADFKRQRDEVDALLVRATSTKLAQQ